MNVLTFAVASSAAAIDGWGIATAIGTVAAAVIAGGALVVAVLSWRKAGAANAAADHANELSGEANQIAERALAIQEAQLPEPWSQLIARPLTKMMRVGSIQNTSGRTVYVIGVAFDKIRVDPRVTAKTSATVENSDFFEFSFISDGQESVRIEWRFADEEHPRVTPRNVLRRD